MMMFLLLCLIDEHVTRGCRRVGICVDVPVGVSIGGMA